MRAQLITFLLREGPRNASTLARNVRRDRSTVSRHLQLMLRAGLLATVPSLTGDGRHETYAIDPRWRVPDEPMAIDVGTALLRFGPRA